MARRCIVLQILAFLSIVSFTKAQDSFSAIQTKTNSLKQLIFQHDKEDEEKVRLLNEYARSCFYDLNYFEGLKATHEARILSEKMEFKGGKVMYYVTLSVYPQGSSKKNYYQKLAERITMYSDQNLDKYYEEIDIPISDNRNDWNALLDEFNDMLKFFEKLDDKELQAIILGNISYCQFQLGNFEEALKAEERIVQLYKDLNQVYPVFNSISSKIYILNHMGKKEEANKLEEELVEFITLNEDENSIGLITYTMASGYRGNRRYALAIESFQKAIKIFEQNRDTSMLVSCYNRMAMSYANLEMYDKSSEAFDKTIAILKLRNDTSALLSTYNNAIFPNFYVKKYDKAREFMALALKDKKNQTYLLARRNSLEGQILKDNKEYKAAIPYFQSAMEIYKELNKISSLPFMPLFLAECYQQLGDLNKALEYALLCLQYESNSNRTKVKSQASLMLSEIYDELGQKQKAYEYLKMHHTIRVENDKLDAANRLADAEVRSIIERSQDQINLLEKAKQQKEQENKTQRLWLLSIAGALISALFILFLLYRNNKQKQKSNALLKKQKLEIEDTLEKLKSTQVQLIQSEKMASLGELTAGIAHEIQNPLNFVNNFSEVSAELMEELQNEIDNGEVEEVKALVNDVIQNLQKINHHGKRAESIVKGMLLHSRGSSGKKEPTDINALADEYLRLSYHGFRAKDKSFNADFKLEADEKKPIVNVVPQDIGRVLLNLINNAFYAVSEKSKFLASEFKPRVIVSTNSQGKNVEISVKDNGNGIPDSVIAKIFQPFFTTKPTGQGTGLGLSLSYDIIKAHGGELKVETHEGEGSEFIIQIPINE